MDGYKILSLESCDIYECNNVNNNKYIINNIKNKYKSMLDDSLDSRYLMKKNKKPMIGDDGLPYTNDIINVKFNMAYKIKKGDKSVIDKNGLSLRKILYKDGFKLKIDDEIIEYVRYKRSSGSSREGKCLFINKDLYEYMNKWSLCGLDENSDKIQNDLVSFEAYKALSLSGIIDTIEIEPENILLVDDFIHTFRTEAINVKKNDKDVVANKEEAVVSNNIWDGEGLLDKSLFTGKYEKNGMMYLRNRFFKGCVFNTNLQDFFNEKGIKDIKQLNGETEANDITDIKLVITKSCLKYLKFGTFKNWLKNVGKEYGIIKVDEPSHFFGGKMIMSTYQFLNTLNFSWNEMKNLISDEVEYLNRLRNDPDFVRFHIKVNKANQKKEANAKETVVNDSDLGILYKKGIITLKLLMTNPDFKDTKMYYDFVTENIDSLINQMLKGKVLINGTYAYLFGNGYELLLNTIGEFDKNNPKSIIEKDTVMTSFYDDGVNITGTRNPHITMGNILCAKNKYYNEYEKWFNFKSAKQIICVNAIGENIQQRLNGCDYDSDSMLITTNPLINELANRNYNKFGVPVCGLEEVKKNEKDLAKIDNDIQDNQIGEIVNLSQWLNSILWDKYNKDNNVDISKVYNDICILAVLSGCEIDRAKREYGISARKIINSIRNKYKDDYEVKPKILRLLNENSPWNKKKDEEEPKEEVKKKNKKKDKKKLSLLELLKKIEKDNDVYYETAMDYLIGLVENTHIVKENPNKKNPTLIELMNITPRPSGNNYENKDSVIVVIENTYNEVHKLRNEYKNNNIDFPHLKATVSQKYKAAMDEIGRKLNNPTTVKLILNGLHQKRLYRLYWDTLYYVLKKNKAIFNACFKKDGVNFSLFPRLIEDSKGDIALFGFKYTKDYPIVVHSVEDPNGNYIMLGKTYKVTFGYKKRTPAQEN